MKKGQGNAAILRNIQDVKHPERYDSEDEWDAKPAFAVITTEMVQQEKKARSCSNSSNKAWES